MMKELIPWAFAYDRQNYARHLPIYYAAMTHLEDDHPDVYDHMLHGGFSVQLGESNPFGRIPVDQTIEETVNKDTQTAGGTKDFSLKVGAVSRYYLTAEYRSTCIRNIRKMVSSQAIGTRHADLEFARIQKDESAVKSILDILESDLDSPFSVPNDLISISTGCKAPEEVIHDLLCAHKQCENSYTVFKQERLEVDPPIKPFYERLQKLQLKTFSDIQKPWKSRLSNKEVVLKADHKLFGHMVLVAANRNLDMQQVLKHPLGPLPWALANPDGTMRKTNKAVLARNLEKRVTPADTIPSPRACLIDGMTILYKMNAKLKTYGDLASRALDSALHIGGESSRIDVVFDVYKDMSIKTAEWDAGRPGTEICIGNLASGHIIHNWRAILAKFGKQDDSYQVQM